MLFKFANKKTGEVVEIEHDDYWLATMKARDISLDLIDIDIYRSLNNYPRSLDDPLETQLEIWLEAEREKRLADVKALTN